MLSYFTFMSTNLEFEAKSMLEKNEYELLKNEFSSSKKYTQKNYYLSSPKISKNLGMRVREKSHKFELTIKVDLSDHKREINQKISRISWRFLRFLRIFPKGEVSSYLIKNDIIDPRELRVIGCMKTERIDVKFLTSLISIDRSKYNHTTDYEIECEDSSYKLAEANLLKFLKTRNIEYKKSKFSKLAKFINSK